MPSRSINSQIVSLFSSTRRTRGVCVWVLGFGLLLAVLIRIVAQEKEPLTPPTVSAPAAAAVTNMPLKQVGPGQFELGQVRLDKRERTVSFPAVLNMSEALIEYFVVTSSGKTHESLLRTDVQPYHVHLAMLLLGAKGAGTNQFPERPDQPLPGDKVTVELSWKRDGKEKRGPAEEWVHNRLTQSPMSKGHWVYNGSRVHEGMFLAQEAGSVISLIEDPDALINNPRPGRENDEAWEVHRTDLPPLNSPVRVTIKLAAPLPP